MQVFKPKRAVTDCEITGHMIKGARALTGLNQKELAKKAGVSVVTLKRHEANRLASFGEEGNRRRQCALPIKRKIIHALNVAGVVFDRNDLGITVSLRKAASPTIK
jgi:DNA-binding XRE family transcriptional regulator